MAQTDRLNGLTGSVAIKAPCRVATTADTTLSGEQTIDGIAVVAGDRVLVKNQTNAVENGIYDVAVSAWTRAADWDGTRDVVTGTEVGVVAGAINAGLFFTVTTTGAILPGTTAVTFSGSGSAAASAAAASASAAAAATSATSAAGSATTAAAAAASATASQTAAAESQDAAAGSASSAQTSATTAAAFATFGFGSGMTLYDLGLVSDAIIYFPTDLGSV